MATKSDAPVQVTKQAASRKIVEVADEIYVDIHKKKRKVQRETRAF